jgi:purine-binding chemotaxis protein CheW
MSQSATAMPSATDGQALSLAGKYLTFRLAGEIYGLPILKVQEIIRIMKITRVPKAPDFVLGVVNLRGKVIPIINMRRKFGLNVVEDTERTCIIVVQVNLKGQTITLGAVVDEVSEVMNLSAEQISKTPPMGASVDTEFIVGMGRLEHNVVMLLDLDKVFSTQELAEMGAGAQLQEA